MSRYSEEFKEQVVRKMMPPGAKSVAQVHRATGISEPTLYAWTYRSHKAHISGFPLVSSARSPTARSPVGGDFDLNPSYQAAS